MKHIDLDNIRVVALAGGVGGAKLVHGLSKAITPENLTVIVNTGDDFTYFGLTICPDIDTVLYTLAGKANTSTGWGLKDDSTHVMSHLALLEGPDWFHLGDKDLATHLIRTHFLEKGLTLSDVVVYFLKIWEIRTKVLPMCDQPVRTMIHTKDGRELSFQEYFVKEHFKPEIRKITFSGIERAILSNQVKMALDMADLIVICPSNPYVSIAPILNVADLKQRISQKFVIGISPIIGGEVVKGPAAKMFREMGEIPSAFSVARFYRELLDVLVIDEIDSRDGAVIEQLGIIYHMTDIMMRDEEDRKRLASEVIQYAISKLNGRTDQ